MSDRALVERLRANAQGISLGAEGMGWGPEDLYAAAADEIERLRAALTDIADNCEWHRWCNVARKALESRGSSMKTNVEIACSYLRDADNCLTMPGDAATRIMLARYKIAEALALCQSPDPFTARCEHGAVVCERCARMAVRAASASLPSAGNNAP